MTLVDAGPLIAIIDRDDEDHEVCVAALPHLSAPLMTSWPAFTEAMYLLGDRAAWKAQDQLWSLVRRRDLNVHDLTDSELNRAYELMKKYSDVPMDLADASLVSMAEENGISRIFTLDHDFRIYRLQGRKAFEIVP